MRIDIYTVNFGNPFVPTICKATTNPAGRRSVVDTPREAAEWSNEI